MLTYLMTALSTLSASAGIWSMEASTGCLAHSISWVVPFSLQFSAFARRRAVENAREDIFLQEENS